MRRAVILGVLAFICSMVGQLSYCVARADASAAVRYVYVEDHTGPAWPVTVAEPWVDQYTGSVMVYGRCRSGYKCIRVYEKWIRNDWFAVTRATATGFVIYMNPQRNGRPYAERLHVTRHELVHAMGYGTHYPQCTDLMYYQLRCPNGTLAPTYLHSTVRTILAQN